MFLWAAFNPGHISSKGSVLRKSPSEGLSTQELENSRHRHAVLPRAARMPPQTHLPDLYVLQLPVPTRAVRAVDSARHMAESQMPPVLQIESRTRQ